jgi:NAD(P)-dependent dehydrogenase (short-subunit alcohol dehydrogenase family)
VALDVRQEEQMKALVERTVKEMGRLDVMVNNAGASFRAKIEDISANGWNTVVGINLNGTFFGCKWAGRQMMVQGGGVIINISSIAGVYGSSMMSHYGASKAAVINFTRTLGMAWGRQGIRVNCIAPGPVETEGYLDVLHKTNPDAKKVYDGVASRVGMGRWGRVEEIAYPCVFLASDAASFMNGATMVIDGGPAPNMGDEAG